MKQEMKAKSLRREKIIEEERRKLKERKGTEIYKGKKG